MELTGVPSALNAFAGSFVEFFPCRQRDAPMETYRSGDVVCLKSGGPDMTVEAVEQGRAPGDEILTCAWFVERTLYRSTFKASSVTLAMWPAAA
jgi:uncharacterized protein YodC (DUF2158 family)